MSSVESPDLPYRVRTDQAHLIAGVIMSILSLAGVLYAPTILFWVPVLPAVFIIWVLRTRTEFTENGITARYLFRPSKSMSWTDFEALRFTRGGTALAVAKDESTFPLPGVSFNSLVTLAEVTDGRIPDPLTPSLRAIDDKVRVVERDSGDAVLMGDDEYKEYETARRASHMAREELERRKSSRQTTDGSRSEPEQR